MRDHALPVIVTRAEPGAAETLQRLRDLGQRAIASPALTLVPRPETSLPDAASLAGLVFTSANGVRTYCARREDRSLTAWCVGPATAAAAREAGFSQVQESAGNARDLTDFIAARSRPAAKPLLHVANMAAAGGLKGRLESHGFTVDFAPIYQMQPASTLSTEAVACLDRGDSAIILIHSAKGAAAFADLIAPYQTEQLYIVAISQAAAEPLARFQPDQISWSDQPNEGGLIRALTERLATLSARSDTI